MTASSIIREVLRNNPNATQDDCQRACWAEGKNCSKQTYYNVKGQIRKNHKVAEEDNGACNGGRPMNRIVAAMSPTHVNEPTTFTLGPIQICEHDVLTVVRKVKELASEVGGMGILKELVEELL